MTQADRAPTGDPGRPPAGMWGNPLARSTDRTESAYVILAFGIWLFALPIVVIAGLLLRTNLSADAAAQQNARTETSALLLADAPSYASNEFGMVAVEQTAVQAEWTAPDRSPHTGTVNAAAGSSTGDRLTIWTDRSGNITQAPMDGAAAAVVAILAAAGAWLLLGVALWLGRQVLRWQFDRRRAANWARDWRQFEPIWSGR